MKQNRINSIFFILLLLVQVSCKKQDLPEKPEPTPFSAVLENAATVSAAGGTVNILISGPTDGWSVQNDQPGWAVISRNFGAGDFKLPVVIRPNTTGIARTVNLKIKPTFNLPTVSISLNQDK